MTNPVKDISCHRNLLLSSLPAPFLQSYLALFTDHSPSFNLFCFLTSLPFLLLYFSRLCPSTNNQIPVMPLASLDALQFLDHAGQFLGLDSVQNESGPAAVVPFSKGGGTFGNINPGSGAAVPNTSPVHQQHPSKALEAASFWQWARWRVLGAAWLTYINLFQHSFLFFFFLPQVVPRLGSPADLAVTLPKALFTSIDYHMTQVIRFYCAKQITELEFAAIGWLTLFACLIILVQCNFLDLYFGSVASCLLWKVSW